MIRYTALCQLEMKCNRSTRAYYNKLQSLIFQWIETRTQQQLREKDELIASLTIKKKASVYRIYDSRTRQLLYVGKDQSKHQNRPQQHLSARTRILQQRNQQIDLALSLMAYDHILYEVTPVDYDEVLIIEAEAIRTERPLYNQTSTEPDDMVCYSCQRQFKRRGAFEKHQQKCVSCEDSQ